MSSNTVIFFPSLSGDLTPLDIAVLERAAWQLEAMNALLAESSLPPVQKRSMSRDRVYVRANLPTVAADEDIKCTTQVSPSSSPELTMVNTESPLFSLGKKFSRVLDYNESIASVSTTDDCMFGPSPSATSDISSEISCFEEVYRTFLAPIRTPLASRDVNAHSFGSTKTVPFTSKVARQDRNRKENQNTPCKLTRRKAVLYPLGVRPTKAIPVTTVAAFRSRPSVSYTPSPKVSPILPSFSDKVNYQDFSFRHLVGSGSQGRVYLARYHRDVRSPLLAIKVLKKSTERDTECVIQEHKVLKSLRGSPFILNLQAAFNDSLNWYLVTDYHCGGSLQAALFKQGHFNEDTVRFYATEMILAVKFLHDNGIIHRDIKLSNVLLRKDGHIVVADFGLVHNFNDGKDYEIDAKGNLLAIGCCGTKTHMAPEILADKVYTYSADWWSFGVCFFSMLQGELPWSMENIGWSGTGPTFQPLAFNPDIPITKAALSILHGLLQKLPQFRMGALDLQAHAFFNEINWDVAEKLCLQPPFIPYDDAELLVDQPLPRYLDFLRGATEPVIPDRFPEFYYLSPALGGDIPSLNWSDPSQCHSRPAHEAQLLVSPPQALPFESGSLVHPSTSPVIETFIRDNRTTAADTQNNRPLPASPSNFTYLDCNVSIPLGSTVIPIETNINDTFSREKSPSILDRIVSFGHNLLLLIKHCWKPHIKTQ